MKRHLITMFAKAPVPGKVKTRLQPPLNAEEAAHLHASFLLDQAERILASPPEKWTGRVSAAHNPNHPVFLEIAKMGVDIVPQRGTNLGDRMACALEEGLEDGFDTVTLIGSDSPTLPWSLLADSVRKLQDHDVCLAPSFDGGFVAISARKPQPSLRLPIPWSVEETLAETTKTLRADKMLVALSGFWYDVDQGEDLRFLERHLAAGRLSQDAPRTAEWMLAHRDRFAQT